MGGQQSNGHAQSQYNIPRGGDIGDVALDDLTKAPPAVQEWRKKNDLTTAGNCPDPWLTYEECPIAPQLKMGFTTAGFTVPSTIQSQAWPAALTGRDVVGVARTGSGKTLGFLVPAFNKIATTRTDTRAGPTTLVLAPTRELAQQIRAECDKFGRMMGVRVTCVYGGAPKGPQLRDVRNGVHIIVATPGRLNDFLENRLVRLEQVQYLVFDEADRMLDMGFEPQIRKILNFIPPQRQTLFFTATWPKEVRRLASEFLRNPVLIYVGNTNALVANKDVTQIVTIVNDMRMKERLLYEIIEKEGAGNRVLVFCSTKRMCNQLEMSMGRRMRCAAIHGDKDQHQRTAVINGFKSGAIPIMIATNVAARGIDIKGVKAVVNYDFPQNTEDYVHRIGRTGRAGAKGNAYTFFTQRDAKKAAGLIKIMELAEQVVPQDLRDMAARAPQMRGSSMQYSQIGRAHV